MALFYSNFMKFLKLFENFIILKSCEILKVLKFYENFEFKKIKMKFKKKLNFKFYEIFKHID